MQTYSLCGVAFSGDYLAHYGIKGQVHGRRRFQNADGSLTAAGRARYGYTDTNTGDSLRDNQIREHFKAHVDARNQILQNNGSREIPSRVTSRWLGITRNANRIQRAGESASSRISDAGTAVRRGLYRGATAIGKAANGTVFQGVAKNAYGAMTKLGNAAEGASKRIAERAKDVGSWASKTYEKLANGFHDTVDKVKMRAGEAMKKASNFVSGIWNKVTEAAKSGFEKAKSVATTAVSKLKQFGGSAINMGKGLIYRVMDMFRKSSNSGNEEARNEHRALKNKQNSDARAKNKAQADFESRNARENKAGKEFGDEMARYYSTPSVQAEHEARKKKGYAR